MKKILQSVLGFLLHPIVIRVIGVLLVFIVLSVGQWLLGNNARWLTDGLIWGITLLVAALVAGLFLFGKLRAKQRSMSIEEQIRQQSAGQLAATMPDQRSDIQALEKRFDDAMQNLKSSRMGGGALYALPWYVIIGPPGCGKTTLLTRSGLNFPSQMNEGRGVRGLGGTRNCDWWFTDSAILLDTAGRYTTESEDHDEWTAFLDMLRKARKECPLNGLMVAISIEDVIGGSPEQLERHAERIRARIDEVTQRLDMVLPVYLMFTKCDLLEGFVEAFSSMLKDEREQVWGRTVSDSDRDRPMHEVFAEGFDELVERLRDRRLTMMAEDRPTAKQRKVFGFPLQFSVGRDRMIDFVRRVTQPDPYRESAELRGFYYTSGTQEGTAVDRVLSDMGGIFDQAQAGADEAESIAPADTKAYFIHDLVTKVIVPDQDLARRSSKLVKRQRVLRMAGFIGSAVATLLFSILLISGTASESGRISEGWEAVKPVAKALLEEDTRDDDKEFDPASKRADEDAMGELRKVFEETAEAYGSQVGLLGPSRQLVDGLWMTYRAALSDAFLEPIARRVKQELEDRKAQLEADPANKKEGDAARLAELLFVYNLLTDPNTLMQPERLGVLLEKHDLWTWDRDKILGEIGERSSRSSEELHKKTFLGAFLDWDIGELGEDDPYFAPPSRGFAHRYREFVDSLQPNMDVVRARMREDDALRYASRSQIEERLLPDAQQVVSNEGVQEEQRDAAIRETLDELVNLFLNERTEAVALELSKADLGAEFRSSVTGFRRLDEGPAASNLKSQFMKSCEALLDGTGNFDDTLYGGYYDACLDAVRRASVTIEDASRRSDQWVLDGFKDDKFAAIVGAINDGRATIEENVEVIGEHSKILSRAVSRMFNGLLNDMVAAIAREAVRELENRWTQGNLSQALRSLRAGFPFKQGAEQPASTQDFLDVFKEGGLLDQEVSLLKGIQDALGRSRAKPYDLSPELQQLLVRARDLRRMLLNGGGFKTLEFSLPKFGPQAMVATYTLYLGGDQRARNIAKGVQDTTFTWQVGTTGAELDIKRGTNSDDPKDITLKVGDAQDKWSLYRVVFHGDGPTILDGNLMEIRVPFKVRKVRGGKETDHVLTFHIKAIGAVGENPFDPDLFVLPDVQSVLKVSGK